MDNTILLIDGSSFIFRAFYAVKNLTSPDGVPTNATYGIINMLKLMEKKYPTRHWACVFDAKGKTFRDDIYPEYKANRRVTPPELIIQIPYIHDIIKKLGIPVIIEDGVEADDVIATIAKKYAAQNYEILIATGDKDFAQIVDDKIRLINTMTNEELDVAGVIAKFGVQPNQIIDYLSLIGDSVDNVPGVHKCGPKTAQKWISDFGSLANLIANKDKLTGVVGENFKAVLNWLPTAQRLITIDTNVAIKNTNIDDINNLSRQKAQYQELVAIFRELNFRTWLKESETALANPNSTNGDLLAKSAADNLANKKHKKLVEIADLNQIVQVIDNIIAKNQITSYTIINNDYTDILSQPKAFVISDNQQIYLLHIDDIASNDLFSTKNHTTPVTPYIQKYLLASCPKIGVNIKNNLKTLVWYNYLAELPNQLAKIKDAIVGDIILASYIYESQQNHSLSAILRRTSHSGIEIQSPEEICGKGAKRLKFEQLSTQQKRDLVFSLNHDILAVHQTLYSALDAKEQHLYLQVELPLSFILAQIETAGMRIDLKAFEQLKHELGQKIHALEESVYQEAKTVFNLNSPKQLQEVLFSQLKLPTDGIKANTTGYSTDEESLSILADQGIHIASLILEHRSLSKLLNTYVDKLPLVADNNQRLHTNLEQAVVTSGRLSSKDPNLQNIPIRNAYGQKIRACFIAEPGHHLVCADYSQIELRILAHISNDKNLITAFNQRQDIHLATASQIFNKAQAEVTRDERSYAKSINFGLIYGKSVFGLAKELKIDRDEAKLYIDNYFAKYPQVKEFMQRIKKDAHQDGYVATIYGRKIYLPGINSNNNILRQAEERLALNAPMQGSAADIIKIAMLDVASWLETNHLRSYMIMQVHDELILQVPDDELDIVMQNLSRLMTGNTRLNVPLEVDVKAAANWAGAH